MRATLRIDRPITDQELVRIGDDNEGWHIERIDGGVVMSPTSTRTGPVTVEATVAIALWAKAHDYVALGADTGVKLPNDDILAPDGALVTRARWSAATSDGRLAGFGRLVPDIVIEIASPYDRRSRLREKCARWLRDGASYVVMIDPDAQTFATWGTPPAHMDIDWAAIAAYEP